MFKEDERTGLAIKLMKMEKAAQNKQNKQCSTTKRKATKATGKRTGGRPTKKIHTPRGKSLQTAETADKSTQKEASHDKAPSNSDRDENSSSASEDVAPSPKRQNQKRTPPTNIATRKSTRKRQVTLTTALGNLIPINAIETMNTPNMWQFETDSPPEKSTPGN